MTCGPGIGWGMVLDKHVTACRVLPLNFCGLKMALSVLSLTFMSLSSTRCMDSVLSVQKYHKRIDREAAGSPKPLGVFACLENIAGLYYEGCREDMYSTYSHIAAFSAVN